MILFVLLISFVIRVIMLFAPRMIWWDGGIYVDMGKYIFSHGTIGFWESFRPIIWPAVLGIFWKLGLNSYNWGIYLQIIAALGAIYLVYKIGEKLKPGSGIYAAIFLSFTPVFLGFTVVPLTDIPSAFLGLAAIYFCITEYYAVSGIFLSLAFLFRFPLFLLCIPLGIIVLIKLIKEKRWQPIVKIVAGTLPLIIIYFSINYALYGNILKPILDGSQVAAASTGAHYKEISFYLVASIAENPFLLFSLVCIYSCIRFFKDFIKNDAAILTVASGLILAGYFTYFPHKELRYSIAFLPYFALMAGVGIETIVKKIGDSIARPTAIICSMLVLSIISYSLISKTIPTVNEDREAYLNFFIATPGARIITSSPQIAVNADVNLARVNGVWEDLSDLYDNTDQPFDYVAIDTCEMACSTNQCDARKQAFLTKIISENTLVLRKGGQNSCELSIYKRITQ